LEISPDFSRWSYAEFNYRLSEASCQGPGTVQRSAYVFGLAETSRFVIATLSEAKEKQSRARRQAPAIVDEIATSASPPRMTEIGVFGLNRIPMKLEAVIGLSGYFTTWLPKEIYPILK
jgi:hypothetical protein